MSELKNISIKCSCGREFLYTVKDQEFYKEKGFVPPKRCRDCRQAKKESSIKQEKTFENRPFEDALKDFYE